MLNDSIPQMSESQKLGLKGETYALRQLEAQGYEGYLVGDFFADIDLLITSLDTPVPGEVKLATPCQHYTGKSWRTRWQWDCSRLPAADTLVVLIAIDEEGEWFSFVVPSCQIKGRCRQPAITSPPDRYTGWLADFRDNWEGVEQVKETRIKQSGQIPLI